MNQTLKLIEQQLIKLGISKKDLASELGLSRGGLYTMLSNFDNIKLSSLMKLSEVIQIDTSDLLLVHNYNPTYAFTQISKASKKLKLNEVELAGYLGTSIDNTTQFKKNKSIEYEYTERFSRQTEIPLEFFLESKSKKEIDVELFIKNQDLFLNNDILKNFFDYLPRFQVKLCSIINENVEKIKIHNQQNTFYIEELGQELNGTIASVQVSILIKGNKKPIVIASNLPTNPFHILHFTQEIFSEVIKQFLNEYTCSQVVWVCNYSGIVENQSTYLVKFEENFKNPEFFQIYDSVRKFSIINKSELQEFLR
ncbi:helix-turn-helix domain-containing protein [Marinifilum sp.]|uniref:helix-turn-helix domain-containing protein n=1 Tax=Marinifilum sp. TaxID=2033137 RepID=UPI003BAB14B8